MSQDFGNAFLKKHPVHPAPGKPAAPPAAAPVRKVSTPPRPQVYTRIFRWGPPAGHAPAPATVEIAGTFTHWQKVPLTRDASQNTWQISLSNLACGRMHHYMLLVDGQPVRDKQCDGLAVPHGSQEEQFQLMTERGPRVLMLFAQTK